jgi:hypothetical protein
VLCGNCAYCADGRPAVKSRIAASGILCFIILPLQALAAVFHIPAGDVTALIAAITTANATAEADILQLQPGVYRLQTVQTDARGPTGLPVISSSITIRGESDLTTLIQRDPGSQPFRIFHVAAEGILTLENVSVRGGLLFGVQNGAGLQNFGVANIQNSSITANGIVLGSGGGIHSTGTLNITKSLISQNDALVGAGISSEGTLVMSNSTVSDNIDGGGIRTSGPSVIRNSTIAFNAGFDPPQAGGIAHSSSVLEVVNTTIAGNQTLAPGGSNLSNFSGTVAITNSTIAENILNSGGLVRVQNTIMVNSACAGEITSLGNNIVSDPFSCPMALLPSDLTGDPGLSDFTAIEEPGQGHFPLLSSSRAINAANKSVCLKYDQLGNSRNGPCDIGSVEFQQRIRLVEELPAAEVNVSYNATLKVIGGVPPYTTEVVKGSLPEGLDLDSLTISGLPLKATNSTFVLKVTDQAGASSNQRLRLRVYEAVKINTQSLKPGRAERAYYHLLRASGGQKPYTWSVIGTLPTGLTFDERTGRIGGRPTSADLVTLTVTVTDDLGGTAEQNLILSIK